MPLLVWLSLSHIISLFFICLQFYLIYAFYIIDTKIHPVWFYRPRLLGAFLLSEAALLLLSMILSGLFPNSKSPPLTLMQLFVYYGPYIPIIKNFHYYFTHF